MVNLPIHLVEEIRLGGPVHGRGMFFIERYLCKLKSYVRNRGRPEGSIAEGFLIEECMNFCSRYVDGVKTGCSKDTHDTLANDTKNPDDLVFANIGYPLGGKRQRSGKVFTLDTILGEQAHRYTIIVKAKDLVGEFSRLLGTIARDYRYAPLVFDSWRKVPNKDKMWEYVVLKYVVPDEGKEWVIRTIGAAWRIHKCRFKKKNYYQYKDDKTRWQNRSKTVPDDDFLKLLAKWKKKSEKIRCSRNRDRRLAQKNMHTAGPKSFASIREEMTNENPDKKPPSLAELFERTRKRKEGNIYKESYEDTSKMIEDMKSYAPDDNGSGSTDAFLVVMGKEYNGRRRLYGRGVCNKKLKQVNGTSTSYVVPGQILESLKTSVVEDLRKDADSEMNRVEIFYRNMEEEHLKKKEELENMQKDLDNQRETMTQEIMKKILEKPPEEIARKYLR